MEEKVVWNSQDTPASPDAWNRKLDQYIQSGQDKRDLTSENPRELKNYIWCLTQYILGAVAGNEQIISDAIRANAISKDTAEAPASDSSNSQ